MPNFGTKLPPGTVKLLRCFQDETCKKKHSVWESSNGTISAVEAFSCLTTKDYDTEQHCVSVQPDKIIDKEQII